MFTEKHNNDTIHSPLKQLIGRIKTPAHARSNDVTSVLIVLNQCLAPV